MYELMRISSTSLVQDVFGGEQHIIDFIKDAKDITFEFDPMIKLLEVNNRVFTSQALKLMEAKKIRFIFNDTKELTSSLLFIPDAVGTPDMHININITPFVKEGTDIIHGSSTAVYKFTESTVFMYNLLLFGVMVYTTVRGKSAYPKFHTSSVRDLIVKAHKNMVMGTLAKIATPSSYEQKITTEFLVYVFGLRALYNVKLESALVIARKYMEGKVTDDNIRAIIQILGDGDVKLAEVKLGASTLKGFIENLNTLILSYKKLTMTEFITKASNAFGVISLMAFEYLPYITGMIMTSKDKFPLNKSALIQGALKEEASLVYTELTMLYMGTDILRKL